MDGEIVDLAREFRIVQPHMPRLGRADRHLDVALDVADLADELGRAGGGHLAVGVVLGVLAELLQPGFVLRQRVLALGQFAGEARVGGIKAQGFAAEVSSRFQRQEIQGQGISGPYSLASRRIRCDSLTVRPWASISIWRMPGVPRSTSS